MSHFSVLIVGPNIEEQLAPFQENNMGDCPKEFMKFNDLEDELREEYSNGTVERIQLDNGERVPPYDERFRVHGANMFEPSHKVPDHLQRIKVPVADEYRTFDEFATKYHGYKKDPALGRYGYWENPNAKWDWYQVGGRFEGKLLLKNGERADQAKKGDIDFEQMSANRLQSARDNWAAYEAAPENQKVHAEIMNDIHRNDTLMTYLGRLGNAAFTFALLKDGQWYERGKMGWWACVSGEKNSEQWEAEYQRLLESLPEDTLLTVVDCHI